jgi:hypothetical protein
MFIPRAQYASPSSMKTLYGLLTFLCSLFFKSFCVFLRFTILESHILECFFEKDQPHG